MNTFTRSCLASVTLSFIACSSSNCNAADEAAPDLATNGNFEAAGKIENWPDQWPAMKGGGTWEVEDGNHFLRLKSGTPGSMVMLYREFSIPPGTVALEISWRHRVSDLKLGAQVWFDARILMEFKGADGAKLTPGPPAPSARKDTDGWQEKFLRCEVPDGARALKFMPALFQVESGTFDLDDIVIKPITSEVKL